MDVRQGPNAITLDGFQLAYRSAPSDASTVIVDTIDGWFDSAPVRSAIMDRAETDGGWDAMPLSSARTITLAGTIVGTSQGDAFAIADTLNGVLASKSLLLLTIDHEEVGERSAWVRPSDQAKVAQLGGSSALAFSVIVTAPDPLKYGVEVFGSTDLSGQASTGRTYAPDQVVATNIYPDPLMSGGASEWSTTGGTVANGPEGGIKVTNTATGYAIATNTTDPVAGLGGASKLYVSADVRVTGAVGVGAQVAQVSAAGVGLGNASNYVAAPAAGAWARVAFVLTLAAGTDHTSQVQLIRSSGAAVGATTEWRNIRMSTVADGPFFSGSTAPDGTYSYRWTGTGNASTSEKYVPGGLQYPLDYGVPAGQTPGSISVGNTGTATYWPRLRIDGPVTNPVVTCNETGDQIRYTGSVLAGQWLDVDTTNRRVLLNGQVSVRRNVTSSGNWLAVPQGGASISWAADTVDPAAQLSVWSYEGAWS